MHFHYKYTQRRIVSDASSPFFQFGNDTLSTVPVPTVSSLSTTDADHIDDSSDKCPSSRISSFLLFLLRPLPLRPSLDLLLSIFTLVYDQQIDLSSVMRSEARWLAAAQLTVIRMTINIDTGKKIYVLIHTYILYISFICRCGLCELTNDLSTWTVGPIPPSRRTRALCDLKFEKGRRIWMRQDWPATRRGRDKSLFVSLTPRATSLLLRFFGRRLWFSSVNFPSKRNSFRAVKQSSRSRIELAVGASNACTCALYTTCCYSRFQSTNRIRIERLRKTSSPGLFTYSFSRRKFSYMHKYKFFRKYICNELIKKWLLNIVTVNIIRNWYGQSLCDASDSYFRDNYVNI